MRTMFKRVVPPRESNIDSDDIDKAPIEGMYDGIGVYLRTSGDPIKFVWWLWNVYARGRNVLWTHPS